MGIFNDFLSLFGIERTNLLAQAKLFRPLYIISGIWQEAGWEALFICNLINNRSGLYEAARIDGASRLKNPVCVTAGPELHYYSTAYNENPVIY